MPYFESTHEFQAKKRRAESMQQPRYSTYSAGLKGPIVDNQVFYSSSMRNHSSKEYETRKVSPRSSTSDPQTVDASKTRMSNGDLHSYGV